MNVHRLDLDLKGYGGHYVEGNRAPGNRRGHGDPKKVCTQSV